jgi:hypothetical protein
MSNLAYVPNTLYMMNIPMQKGYRTYLSSELSRCRCFGSDRAPGVAPRGAFWSRTVLLTVARWFALHAREAVDNFVQVRVALRCVTPYVLA